MNLLNQEESCTSHLFIEPRRIMHIPSKQIINQEIKQLQKQKLVQQPITEECSYLAFERASTSW